MVFSSDVFLLAFLPTAYLVFLLVRRMGSRQLVLGWLILASLFFYGWWNPSYLGLILISVIANFGLGRTLNRIDPSRRHARKAVLVTGLVGNLGAIAYYKYAGFFVTAVNDAFGVGFSVGEILLPLAISFFTFQQIAFLVDSYRNETRDYEFLDYCLYVVFFPQLIAGPIVYHREAIPQYQGRRFFSTGSRDFSVGLTMLLIGLAKKVLLADNLAVHANAVFDGVAQGGTVDPLTAWTGTLAYTFQLYFDFSGYSDMAIGLARMFGIRLPFNFHSPYKAVSITDFWRRWHMTLSRFLRDYLYIPLGGNRKGRPRRYVNLLVTMTLGGLWHGAGWTFVAWGVLHGLYLCVNHAWVAALRALGLGGIERFAVYRAAAWAVTFVAVVAGWVFFRAENFATALVILDGMSRPWSATPGSIASAGLADLCFLAAAAAVAFFLPNSQQWMRLRPPLAKPVRAQPASRRMAWPTAWRPSPLVAGIFAAAAFVSLYSLRSGSEFLYFQF